MENLNNSQTKILMDKARKARQEKFLESSRKRLDKIVGTKIKTTFIGSIAAFEEEFGFLWGHGIDDELTNEQENMRDLWNKVRTRILNNGNNQIRAASNEIDNHLVHWNRYNIQFNKWNNSELSYEPQVEN